MQLTMGSSLLLVGLLAVSIPIIIHLLHRQKTTPLLWGAMMFLKESPLQMKRRKQVDHWLLMLLRMAALALLAWLLARPLLNNNRLNPLANNQPADVAVVLDHSMSMGRHSGDHTLFEEAQSVVEKLTDVQSPILRGGDSFSVILAEHRPRALNPFPLSARDGVSLAKLRDQIHALKPGMTDCTIPESIEAAREVLRHGLNRRKMVLVVSDEQKSNWDIGDNAAWQRAIGESVSGYDHHLEVFDYPLSTSDQISNITIGDISIQPSVVGINRPVQLTATVSNSGPNDVASLNVHFSVNGQESGAAQTINSLGAGQSVTVRFDHTFTTSGSAWVRIWTDVVDALAADNESVASIYVWQKLPVLVIDGQLTGGNFRNSMFLTSAMLADNIDQSATSLIQPKVISVSDSASVNLDDYYAVVLNDVPQLPADVRNKLPGYVNSGHGLWIVLGPRTSSQFITSLGKTPDGGPSLFNASIKAGKRNEAIPPPVEIKDSNNPMVAAVMSSERNALASAVTKQWWSIAPKDSDTKVVLASTTGDPLILERPMKDGRVVVWATSADQEWNTWPVMPNFVPLVNETIYYLSEAQRRAHNSGNIEPGASIAWSGPASPAIAKVDVTLPDGALDAGHKPTFRNGHWELFYQNTFLPGLYQLRFTPTEVPQPIYYGVSINRRELDNTALSTDDQEWLKKGKYLNAETPRVKPEQLAYIVTRVDEGFELWPWLAGFVLLSLCAETYMTYRMTQLQKTVNVANAGLLAKA